MILPRYLIGDVAAKHRGIRNRIPEVIDVYISGGHTTRWGGPVDINDVELSQETQARSTCDRTF